MIPHNVRMSRDMNGTTAYRVHYSNMETSGRIRKVINTASMHKHCAQQRYLIYVALQFIHDSRLPTIEY